MLVYHHLGPRDTYQSAQQIYTRKEVDRFDQDYVEKKTLNSTTPFV
jgi:hypothetical protein